ncbi:hypothetical protein AB0M54_40420 [Actinoplanes sp. NPDC051470]
MNFFTAIFDPFSDGSTAPAFAPVKAPKIAILPPHAAAAVSPPPLPES